MPKSFQPYSLSEFKGINYNTETKANIGDGESPNMSNYNVNSSGFLEKRKGLVSMNAANISGLTPPLRILGIQRNQPAGAGAWVWFTNGVSVWKASLPGVTSPTVVTQVTSGFSMAQTQWAFEYGLTIGFTPYRMYFVASVAVPTTCGMSENDPGLNTVIPLTNTPTGTHGVIFKDRSWIINSISNTDESKLSYSTLGNPGEFTAAGSGNIIFGYGDGDFLVCTVPFNDVLIVFKSKSTWVLTADGEPNQWISRILNPTIGCVGRGTPRVIGGFLYFLSADGVYKTDGTTFELISDPVRDLVTGLRDFRSPLNVLYLDAAYWDEKYILFLGTSGVMNSYNWAVVYDTRKELWTKWDFAGSCTISGTARYQEYGPDTLYLGDKTVSRIYTMGQSVYTDNGNVYQALWKSKAMDFGDPVSYKRNHFLAVDTAPLLGFGPTSYTVQHYTDQATPAAVVRTNSMTSRKLMKFKGAGYARWIQTDISTLDTLPSVIYSITWENEVKNPLQKSLPV